MESFKVSYGLSKQEGRTKLNIAVEKQSKSVIFFNYTFNITAINFSDAIQLHV